MIDPITETDLHAFVDGQLPAERRLEVEDHLAKHPEIAARVMADLRTSDALKLTFEQPLLRRPQARVFEAARRLERGLSWRRIGLRLRRAASVAILVGTGWLAHAEIGLLNIGVTEASPQPPAFVEDARHSHETSLIRARMVSQPEAPEYDPHEILRETGISLPSLPNDWRVMDAQVFPASTGHSVELAVEAGSLGRLFLFVSRVPAFGVIRPTVARSQAAVTAYWQTGELVYALTGPAPEAAVERAAVLLAEGLN